MGRGRNGGNRRGRISAARTGGVVVTQSNMTYQTERVNGVTVDQARFTVRNQPVLLEFFHSGQWDREVDVTSSVSDFDLWRDETFQRQFRAAFRRQVAEAAEETNWNVSAMEGITSRSTLYPSDFLRSLGFGERDMSGQLRSIKWQGKAIPRPFGNLPDELR
jgi:hypothetical protein